MEYSLLQKTQLNSENKEMNMKYKIKRQEIQYMDIKILRKKRTGTDTIFKAIMGEQFLIWRK